MLSGGQQQRLCIARAISVKPDISWWIIAASALDPTCDSPAGEAMLELKDFTIIIVTHSMQLELRVGDLIAVDIQYFPNAKLQSTAAMGLWLETYVRSDLQVSDLTVVPNKKMTLSFQPKEITVWLVLLDRKVYPAQGY